MSLAMVGTMKVALSHPTSFHLAPMFRRSSAPAETNPRTQLHLSEPHRKETPMTKRYWLFASAVLALVLGTSVGFASARPLGTITVSDSTAAATSGMSSHFT